MPKIIFAPGTEEILKLLDVPREGKRGQYGGIIGNFPLEGGEWWYGQSDEGPYSHGGSTAYGTFEEAIGEIDDVEGGFYLTHASQWTHDKASRHAGEWLVDRMREYVCDNGGDGEYAEDYLDKITRDPVLSDQFNKLIQDTVVRFMDVHNIPDAQAFDDTRRTVLVNYHVVGPDTDDEEIIIDSIIARGWTMENLYA